jgi:hypothetical protein
MLELFDGIFRKFDYPSEIGGSYKKALSTPPQKEKSKKLPQNKSIIKLKAQD